MQRSSVWSNVLSLLAALVAASVVLGVLAAGLLMPATGVAGNMTKEVMSTFNALPASLTISPISQQTKFIDSKGVVIATLSTVDSQPVPLSKISPNMLKAQVAIEDDRFYEHGGIDPRGLARAMVATLQRNTQGASTITQQLVKMTLQNRALAEGNQKGAEAAVARSGVAGGVRKLQEMKYAVALERQKSKREILEAYLNTAFYGQGAYGIEAAARRYFSIPASQLNLPQAALLAGLVQQPSSTDPINNPRRAKARRDVVIKRMLTTKVITLAQANAALRTDVTLKPSNPKMNCLASAEPYICTYLSRYIENNLGYGESNDQRQNLLFKGGLTVRTTIDVELSKRIAKSLAARVRPTNGRGVGAAAAVVEPGTGKVIAIAQNTKYSANSTKPGETGLVYSVDNAYGSSSGFQIGSTGKVFNVVTALKQGLNSGTTIVAPPDGTKYSSSRLGGGPCGVWSAPYGPYNAEENESGAMSLQHATALSVNTAFLALGARVGICNIKSTMKDMGLHKADGTDYGTTPSALILGAQEASPLTLAASYATLPAGGIYCEPRPIESIRAFDGTRYSVKFQPCRRAIEPQIALDTTRILQTVLTSGTGRGLGIGRPAAGKTGTSDESVHTWFAGYTPQRSAAVWVGNAKRYRSINGFNGHGHVYGATIAGPLWRTTLSAASQGLPAESFRRVEGSLPEPTPTKTQEPKADLRVPDVQGLTYSDARDQLREAGFKTRRAEEREFSDWVSWGRVVRTDPASGSTAKADDTITIYVSKGPQSATDEGTTAPTDGTPEGATTGDTGNGDSTGTGTDGATGGP